VLPVSFMRRGEVINSDLLFRFVLFLFLWIEVLTSLFLFNFASLYVDRSLVSSEFIFS
jgi:hypothetical protein